MHALRHYLYLLLFFGLVITACSSRQSNPSSGKAGINKYNEAGKKNGPWETYQDSILVAKGSYDNGERDGFWTYWYPDGTIKAEGNYKHGVQSGIWCEWYRDGDLMWKGEYQDGKRDIGYPDATVEIKFIGEVPEDNVLIHNQTYHIQIRIPNIPSSYLFVESSRGNIIQEDESDLFILEIPQDTSLILAIGYVETFEFEDFRHLVKEIEYIIR